MGFAREASPSSTGTQRVSLKDIADELGISQTAVSFAINDRPGVSAEPNDESRRLRPNLVDAGLCRASVGLVENHDHRLCPARSAQGLTDETFMLHFMAGVHTSLSLREYACCIALAVR